MLNTNRILGWLSKRQIHKKPNIYFENCMASFIIFRKAYNRQHRKEKQEALMIRKLLRVKNTVIMKFNVIVMIIL